MITTKQTPRTIANNIISDKVLLSKIKNTDNSINRMMLIVNFIIDFDTYYVDNDKDIHPNLWKTVYNML